MIQISPPKGAFWQGSCLAEGEGSQRNGFGSITDRSFATVRAFSGATIAAIAAGGLRRDVWARGRHIMRKLIVVLASVMLTTTGFAQGRGGSHGGYGGGRSSGGNGFRGGQFSSGRSFSGGFRGGRFSSGRSFSGGFVGGGRRGYVGGYRGRGWGGYRGGWYGGGRALSFGFGWYDPWYYGGGYPGYYDYGYYGDPYYWDDPYAYAPYGYYGGGRATYFRGGAYGRGRLRGAYGRVVVSDGRWHHFGGH
jgi:hypothetical protein